MTEKKMPTTEKVKETVYRFGDQAPDKAAAFTATTQIFSSLTLVKSGDKDYLFGEFVIIEQRGQPVAFVDLVRGVLVPFSSVAFAEPA